MNAMTGKCGLIPEQVWDAEPLPGRGLVPGGPTGGAMPLVWAHAELLRLLAARPDGRPIELLDVVRDRYGGRRPRSATWYWRDEVPFVTLASGRALVIEGRGPFVLHFSLDGWAHTADRSARPLGLGMFGACFEREELEGARQIRFTRFFLGSQRWEGHDHVMSITTTGSSDTVGHVPKV